MAPAHTQDHRGIISSRVSLSTFTVEGISLRGSPAIKSCYLNTFLKIPYDNHEMFLRFCFLCSSKGRMTGRIKQEMPNMLSRIDISESIQLKHITVASRHSNHVCHRITLKKTWMWSCPLTKLELLKDSMCKPYPH